MGRSFPCSVGRCGIGVKTREGDGITPVGTFKILRTYIRTDRIRGQATPIRLQMIWSDDPADPQYNTPKPKPIGRYSFERMRRPDPMYDIVADVDFNRSPITPGVGSAIFLHVWRKPRHPTEGCIGFDRKHLATILADWNSKSRVILRP